jgi:cytochrome c biogenesis protein CcmG/thiol:disulfide interchange protein DsbE
MKRFLIPLAAFIVLLVFLAIGLNRDPRDVPSPLVGKPAPAFTIPILAEPTKNFGPEQMQGKVWLLNVWSSWCVSCRQEHPVLVAFSNTGQVPIVGLNYKEVRGDGGIDWEKLDAAAEKQMVVARASNWLSQHGNPYLLSALDIDGRVGINYGVYGVPETYVIDKTGIIRMKHTGPITPESMQKRILPLVAELSK